MTIRNALYIPGYSDGIDVSRVQRIDDAQALVDAGFSFALIKTSEALTYCDPRAQEHLSRCRDVGMMVGGYGFARPGLGQPRERSTRAPATSTSSAPRSTWSWRRPRCLAARSWTFRSNGWPRLGRKGAYR